MQTDWSTGRSDDQGHDGAAPETPTDGQWVPGHDARATRPEGDTVPDAVASVEAPSADEGVVEEDAHRSAVEAVDGLLDEVERALARLDDGTYGRCEVCGSPIEDTDLAARPLVRECGRCSAGVLVVEGA
jgi:RNA polymerase-binding transcription factor DksA